MAGSWLRCCVRQATGGLAQAPAALLAGSSALVRSRDHQTDRLDPKAGRYITMQGTNRFVAKYYTLKLMIAAAYDLSPKVISGGPAWIDSDHYDIEALTPGDARPSRPEQMAMLQNPAHRPVQADLPSRAERIFNLRARKSQRQRAEAERKHSARERPGTTDLAQSIRSACICRRATRPWATLLRCCSGRCSTVRLWTRQA